MKKKPRGFWKIRFPKINCPIVNAGQQEKKKEREKNKRLQLLKINNY